MNDYRWVLAGNSPGARFSRLVYTNSIQLLVSQLFSPPKFTELDIVAGPEISPGINKTSV